MQVLKSYKTHATLIAGSESPEAMDLASVDGKRSEATAGNSAHRTKLEEELLKLRAEVKELQGPNDLDTCVPYRDQSFHSNNASLAPEAEDVTTLMKTADVNESSANSERRVGALSLSASTNIGTLMGSALAKSRVVQALIYLTAFGGIVFVLVARATHLGAYDEDEHRRLGAGASPLLVHIAFAITCSGMMAFFMNLLRLPLLLGYLFGGVLVGPVLLDIIHSHSDIEDMSRLGQLFLLFMIGVEMDVTQLFNCSRQAFCTGFLQFPACAALNAGVVVLLQFTGLSFGSGDYAATYVGVTCSISSSMIVLAMLSEHGEMDTIQGEFTFGILIFQDVWALAALAVQPELTSHSVSLKVMALVAGLIIVALLYAKYVMPAVFTFTSKSVELMLIIALAWCFFMCCLATLPFVGLSMELAALASGVALATFPYSDEFNAKIKYIRDFFVTLFYVGLGTQVLVPTWQAVAKGLLVAAIVFLVRWIGLFGIALLLGSGERLATLATINLSQVGSVGLVILSLGVKHGHIDQETFTIVMWAFAILAVTSTLMMKHNYTLYGWLVKGRRKIFGYVIRGDTRDLHEEGGNHVERNIVLIGFHTIAAMLVSHLEHHKPELLAKLHVIDFHEHIMPELRRKGITCTYGDISVPEALQRAHHSNVALVISTIPDSMLRGISNSELLTISKQVWPKADVIVTAEYPREVQMFYQLGADYVLRMAKLAAERLHNLIADHCAHAVHHQHATEETTLTEIFDKYKDREKDRNMRNIHV